MKIKILYEDANILAIDKPSGILVHSDERTKGETIESIFKKKFPKLEIVHRLDRDTSGVMLLAKNSKAHEVLKKQFMGRTIKKIYHAIVEGNMKNDKGIVNKPIGRSPADFRRYLSGRGARGTMREAVTEYKVLKRFTTPSPLLNKEGREGIFTYLEVSPKTGRTHQIRVHLKSISAPIVCDSLYNPKGICPKALGRMALHAHSIEFNLPAQAGKREGKRVKIESPLPKEFKKLLA